MLNNDLQEKIEKYHSGEMSAGDKTSFESEIDSNPELRAESNLQGDIISGVKEYRKAQLKMRLDTINVSPGWLEFMRQSALVKSFGGVAVATLIGSAVYFLADEKVENVAMTPLLKIEAIGPQVEQFDFEWSIPTLVQAPIRENSKGKVVTVIDQEDEASMAGIEVKIAAQPPTVEEKKTFTPDFNAPEVEEIGEEKELVSSSLDMVPVVPAGAENRDPIEVETKNSKNAKIRYKYYDGKLFLNGNFNKEPYEILEINSAKGRRIYLLHQRKYFEVKTTDRLTELPEVTNIKLIQELRLLKENK